jgi:hypothetical protein
MKDHNPQSSSHFIVEKKVINSLLALFSHTTPVSHMGWGFDLPPTNIVAHRVGSVQMRFISRMGWGYGKISEGVGGVLYSYYI